MRQTEDLGIVDALAQLTFQVQGALARRAAAHDLSMIQVRLLGVLRGRTAEMGELAAALGLDKSSVTGLVDRAEARGLVARARSQRDGRVTQVKLTRRGRALTVAVGAEFESDLHAMLEPLTGPELSVLSGLASRVVGAWMSEMAEPDSLSVGPPTRLNG